MEAIDVVLHAHVKRGRDRALLLVAPDMEVAVGSAIGQPVDERRIAVEVEYDWPIPGGEAIGQPVCEGTKAVETEYDWPIPGEERVVVGFAQSMRVLRGGLEPHQ